MRLYTETHVTQVFLMGLLNGFLASVLIYEVVSGFKTFKMWIHKVRNLTSRAKAGSFPVKSRIPTAVNSEYRV